MKNILCSVLFLIAIPELYSVHAQILSVSPGTDLVIRQGTIFYADNLILTPSVDFILSNMSLERNATVSAPGLTTYIARVYKFSTGTNIFSGTIQINYQDGVELNSLAETHLQLNVHNGITWQAFAPDTNNTVNNYVLTTSLSGLSLNELTLGVMAGVLPLQWRSFTVEKQQNNVLLQWSTFTEQNSRYFILQTSANGNTWNTMATVSAAGNSSSIRNYNYLHTSPADGYNYYRVIETGINGRYNYSLVRKVRFEHTPWHIELLGNPVVNGMLEIKITLASPNDVLPILKLYTSDGRLLWTKRPGVAIQSINVNGYPKGTYLLQANEKTLKFLIQ